VLRAAADNDGVKKLLPQMNKNALSSLPLALMAGRYADARATLAGRSEWHDALALRTQSHDDNEPSLATWALAQLLHDSEAAAREEGAFNPARDARVVRINARLAPDDDEAQDALKVVQQHSKG
jgi:hypothetical protein